MAIRVPKSVAAKVGLKAHDNLEIEVQDGNVVLKPQSPPSVSKTSSNRSTRRTCMTRLIQASKSRKCGRGRGIRHRHLRMPCQSHEFVSPHRPRQRCRLLTEPRRHPSGSRHRSDPDGDPLLPLGTKYPRQPSFFDHGCVVCPCDKPVLVYGRVDSSPRRWKEQ